MLYCSTPREDVLLSRNIIPLLLALASLVAAPARGFAEELRQVFQQDLSDFADPPLTPKQLRQRVEDARRQAEPFVAQARTHTRDPFHECLRLTSCILH